MKTINKFLRASFCLALMACCLWPISLGAQSAFKGVALPAAINTAYDELVPRLSPDDQTLYFVRFQHPENVGGRAGGQDIWYSARNGDGSWSPAQNAGATLNNLHHNFVGAVLENGNALLLGNTYAAEGKAATPGIALSRKVGAAWAAPTTVLGDKNFPKGSKYIDFYATPDGKILILSLVAAGSTNEDLAVCFAQGNGFYSPPQPLGEIINTATGFETGPFLSADTKTLFFTSNGLGGLGNADIFVSTRLDESWSNWSEPVNLGPEVNTAGFDGHFIIDSKGEKGYFVSGPTAVALGDIYEIPIQDIPVLRVEEAETLQVYTMAGVPYPLDLEPYGINARTAPGVTTDPIDGPGLITPDGGKGTFTYRPSGIFQGVEHIEVMLCDPPQSDDCRKVIVEAHVGMPEKPVVAQLVLRTPKNTPAMVNSDIPGLNIPESKRLYKQQPGPKGEINLASGTEPALNYLPAKDFVGTDSIRLYGPCPNGETANCLRAVVKIEVYDVPAVVVVDTPKVVVVVDTPKVVVVDTPKVVVVDTPKVVVVETPVNKDVLVSGIVTDETTGKPLDVEINFYDKGKLVGTTKSAPGTGAYKITLPAGIDYAIEAKQDPFYFPLSDMVNTGGKAAVKGQVTKDLAMRPMPMEVGQTFVLKNIYFDLDKSILKPESKDELTRLHDLLSQHPTMEIQVSGHTDSQASDDYNQRLSESRAAAVVNYLKYKGVMGYRISSKGYGEKVPVATNETEEGRALNRRVEFTIVKM